MIALALLPLAAAWSSERRVWAADDLPAEIVWSGLPEGLDHAEVTEALDNAAGAWASASCGSFDVRFIERAEAVERGHDGMNALVFGDPVMYPERVAATIPYEGDQTILVQGLKYADVEESDITVAAGLVYASDTAIADGCSDAFSFQAAITRAIGYLAGLGPSCTSVADCAMPGMKSATMYEVLESCDSSASSLEEDDRLGIRWLYGHAFSASCEPTVSDTMAAVCTVTAPEGGQARWDFGDGTTGEGAAITHTYAEPGAYLVTACSDIEGCDTPSCEQRLVWAVGAGTVTGTEPSAGEEPAPVGCTSADPKSYGVLGPLLMLLLARSRRALGAPAR